MPEPQIVAMGGFPDDAMLDHVLGLARGTRMLYVPTADREDTGPIVYWYDRLRERGTMTHLQLLPVAARDLRELALDHDVILVAGGNTANASRSGACTDSTRSSARRGKPASS